MALDAIRGEKTLAELAKQHDVHPNQITDCKNQLLERAAGVFGAEHVEEPKADLKELHAKSGQQALEIDFLSGALGKAGLLSRKNEQAGSRTEHQTPSRTAKHRPGQRLLRASGGSDAGQRIGRFTEFYNTRRPHSSLGKKTPDELYFASLPAIQQAA